jgi:hypothetical protein
MLTFGQCQHWVAQSSLLFEVLKLYFRTTQFPFLLMNPGVEMPHFLNVSVTLLRTPNKILTQEIDENIIQTIL